MRPRNRGTPRGILAATPTPETPAQPASTSGSMAGQSHRRSAPRRAHAPPRASDWSRGTRPEWRRLQPPASRICARAPRRPKSFRASTWRLVVRAPTQPRRPIALRSSPRAIRTQAALEASSVKTAVCRSRADCRLRAGRPLHRASKARSRAERAQRTWGPARTRFANSRHVRGRTARALVGASDGEER
jgi:hypothetical protein